MAQDQHTATKSASLQRERRERGMAIKYLEADRALLAAGKPIPLEFLPDPVRLQMKIKSDEEIASKDPNKNRFLAENKGVLEYILKELGFEEFPESDMGKIKLEITWKYATSILSEGNDPAKKSHARQTWKAEYKQNIDLKDRIDLTTEEKEEVYGLLERLSTFKEDVKTFCNYNVAAIRVPGRTAMAKASRSNRYKDLSVPQALEIRRRKEEIPTRDLPNPVRLMQDITSKESHEEKAELNDLLEYILDILDKMSIISKSGINKNDKVELGLRWMIACQYDWYKELCERLASGEEVEEGAKTIYEKYYKKKSDFVKKHGLKNNLNAAIEALLKQMSGDMKSIFRLTHKVKPTPSTTASTTSSPQRKRRHGKDTKRKRQEKGKRQEGGERRGKGGGGGSPIWG